MVKKKAAKKKAKKKATKKKATKKKAKTISKELRCFIIMPFTKAEYKDSTGTDIKLTKSKLKHIYEKLIQKAVNAYSKKNVKFVSVYRYEKRRGNFVKGIINDLDNADLVIADLTGLNPNVFYELGIRHTLKVGTIMLTQSLASLPADLRSYVAFEYKYPQESDAFDEYYPLFEKELHTHIDEYLEDYKTGEPDNPVRDFIGSRNIFQNEQRIREIKANISLMNLVLNEYVHNVKNLGSHIEVWGSGETTKLLQLKETVKPFLNRVMILGEKTEVISFLTALDTSHAIIHINMEFVRTKVLEQEDIKAAYGWYYSFRDMNGKKYHVLDLYKHYKGSGKKEDCPIYKSFQKFISDWESELKSLTS